MDAPADDHADPSEPRRFLGWRVVAISAIAFGLSGPGQTMGVSAFVDPMMDTLGLSRSEISTAYMIGTLAGAFGLPRIGRFIDDRGPRLAMALIAGVFGVLLAAMAGVTGLATLVVGFVGIRMLGQGGLMLVATTAVAPWFRRRRGLAIGTTTAFGSAMMSMVPIAATLVIAVAGWRAAWLVLGATVVVVVVPLALAGVVDRPELVGQQPDGARDGDASTRAPSSAEVAFTRGQALRTPIFWAVASGAATAGMIATALGFHQISLLGAQGLSPVQAAANFLPQTIAGLAATLSIGPLLDRFPVRWALVGPMCGLASAMAFVPLISSSATAAVYGMLIGASGGSMRTVEAAAFPRLFGTRHLGAIRGVVTSMTIASTAFGPLLLSLAFDATGSYVGVLRGLLVLPLAVAVFALVAREPGTTYEPAVSGRPSSR